MTLNYYSDSPIDIDSLAEIRRILVEIGIGPERLDALTTTMAERYQAEIDSRINSILSPYYHVPLVKITRHNRYLVNNIPQPFWPDPIGYIAVRLVATEISLIEFKEIDAIIVDKVQTLRQRTLEDLNALVSGSVGPSRRLDGQHYAARFRFAPPTIVPLENNEVQQGGAGL